MKKLKEDLRKEIYANEPSDKIVDTQVVMQQMYEEAEKSRKKYNEFRISMVEKSLNQVIRKYEY